MESDVIKEVAAVTSAVIATGGGAVLDPDNMRSLRKNGRIYFIDRPLSDLVPTSSRPLALTREDIEKRYSERYGTYCRQADVIIDAAGEACWVSEQIIGDFYK